MISGCSSIGVRHLDQLDQLLDGAGWSHVLAIGVVLNTIEANMRTEELLKQSQSLAGELQSRQEELQKTNHELEDKARLAAANCPEFAIVVTEP